MRKYLLTFFIICLFFPLLIKAQTKTQPRDHTVDYPWVPRVSAYEAYVKYKEGKAIIMHAGGESYYKRHISGAFNVERFGSIEKHGYEIVDPALVKFPKKGIEIFTYCY
jgi:hypothetical protein